MTKREIIKQNKKAIECILERYELNGKEMLDLFGILSIIGTDFLVELSEIIPEEGFQFDYEKMNIRDSIKLVREFLVNIDKKYLEIFDKALNDGTFELFLEEDDLVERPDEPITMPKPNAIIYIPVQNKITDGQIIIHEFFHYLNDNDDIVVNREVFTEMISIYFELRFCNFLEEKGITKDLFNKEVCERLDNALLSGDNLCFSSSSLDIYYNTGEINKRNIKFLDKYRQIYDYNKDDLVKFYHDSDFIDGILDFNNDVSYVIGTLLSFYALKEPIIYDIKMKYINDNINSMKIEDVFNSLDTNFGEYLEWLNACKDNLEIAMGEVYEKSYSDSRSNSSR